MAKPPPKVLIETPVVLMRKVSPEHFEVLEGVVTGELSQVKILEHKVSLVVGRGTARKALAAAHRKASAVLGLTVDS